MSRVVECRNFTGGYANVPAVRGLDLHVDAGEVVVLLGPNGAGKTTTLMSIAGVLRLLSGEVEVLGAPTHAGRPHLTARRGCAFVPDDRSLFFGLSARDNIRLGLKRSDRRAGVDRVLEYFPELEPRMSVRAGALSGGEQQMVAIGRALVSRPKALLVDEMSLGLAPVLAKKMMPIVGRLAVEEGIGILLVEQHVDLALGVADRAYVLNHGEVILSGSATELAQRRNLVEASYLGELSDVYEESDKALTEE
jgi:branched-chain amino acid transport system ATP-binding protein